MTISYAELRLIDWQYDKSGSFYKLLFECISKADNTNLARLGEGFPEEVMAYKRFTGESGYWDKLIKQYETNLSEGRAHGDK